MCRGGASAKLQWFLVASTCLLYLVAAGLFSRSVWYFETQQWNLIIGGDAAELGNGPGTYDIDKSVWHINVSQTLLKTASFLCFVLLTRSNFLKCCNPEANDGTGWGVFNAILGWTNSATYGSVISYNVYWIFVVSVFLVMRFQEVHGHFPFMKAKTTSADVSVQGSGDSANGQEKAPAAVRA